MILMIYDILLLLFRYICSLNLKHILINIHLSPLYKELVFVKIELYLKIKLEERDLSNLMGKLNLLILKLFVIKFRNYFLLLLSVALIIKVGKEI